MTLERMKQRGHEFWKAFNAGDTNGTLESVSDDVRFTMKDTTPVFGTKQGINGMRAHLDLFVGLVEVGAQMRVEELVAEDQTVLCLSSGLMQARTSASYNNCYAFVFRFRDYKVISVTEFLDTALVEPTLFARSIR